MKGIFKTKFAGKMRGFAWNMLTWEYVSMELKTPMEEILPMLQGYQALTVMRVLLYSGLQSYADLHNEQLELTSKEVGAAMGDDDKVLKDIIASMMESMGTGKASTANENVPAKKKSSLGK